MLESLLTMGAGAITGFVGNIVTTIFAFKQQREKNKHEIAMITAQTDAAIKEAEISMKVTEKQIAGDIEKTEAKAFADSVKSALKPSVTEGMVLKLFESKWTAWAGGLLVFLLGFTDVAKQIIRPGVTLYLIIVMSVILFRVEGQIEAGLMGDAFHGIVDGIIYLTFTTVTWWFADRRTAKVMNRSQGWKK